MYVFIEPHEPISWGGGAIAPLWNPTFVFVTVKLAFRFTVILPYREFGFCRRPLRIRCSECPQREGTGPVVFLKQFAAYRSRLCEAPPWDWPPPHSRGSTVSIGRSTPSRCCLGQGTEDIANPDLFPKNWNHTGRTRVFFQYGCVIFPSRKYFLS